MKNTSLGLLALLSIVALSFSSCLVNPAPEPCFSYTVTDATFNFNSGCSTRGNTFQWDFGDGSTSFQENPVHTYEASGIYEVTLLVTAPKGKTETYSESVTVTVTGTNSSSLPSGTFSCSESCSMSGQPNPYAVTISPISSQPSKANIVGLWETGYRIVVADFSSDGQSFTIAPQGVTNGCNLSSSSGTVSSNGNTITLTYTVDCNSTPDVCTATLTK